MVFGWGKKKSRQNVSEVAPQKKQILLSDVSNVANEIRSIRTKTIIADYMWNCFISKRNKR